MSSQAKPTMEIQRGELEGLLAEVRGNMVTMTTDELSVTVQDAIDAERESCARLLERHHLHHSAAMLRLKRIR